jgi:uncharacterized membrane protein (UPF0136 family)
MVLYPNCGKLSSGRARYNPLMSPISIVLYVYAAILLLGGIMGYAKAKSTMSLVSGIVSAVIAAGAAALEPSNQVAALWIGTILALVLAFIFAMRFTKTKKPVPALPMMLISDIVVLICVLQIVALHRAGAH